jgi:hypothetical protein
MARGLCKTVPMGQPVVIQTKIGPRCGVCGTGPNRLLGGRITRQFRFVCDSACGLTAHHPSAHCSMGGASSQYLPNPSMAPSYQPQIGSYGQMGLPGY